VPARLPADPVAPRDADGGFTITEVVVAMAIFLLVATGAVIGTTAGIHSSADTQARVGAVNIAQSDLEQARANPTPAPTSYTTSAGPAGRQYTVSRSVAAVSVTPTPSTSGCPPWGEQQISVTVRWSGGPGSIVRVATVLACGPGCDAPRTPTPA
jgi:prepilin-type N-terminal cleavage/methylation domain-containing protein